MAKPKDEASNEGEIRRHKPFILPESKPDHLTPAERLAEHQASRAHRGPHPGTVRLTIRSKYDNEAPLVRGMYDIANKPKRRSRRRKRCDNGCPLDGPHKFSCPLAGRKKEAS